MKSQLSIETLTKMIKKNIFCDYGPRISHDAFPLNDELVFHLFVKNWFLEKDLESPLIFVLFFKGKTK